MNTASGYHRVNRLCPCSAAARPRRGFEVGERFGHLFPVPALRKTDENRTEIVSKLRPEGPKSSPGPSWGLSLASCGSFEPSWGSLWASWGSLWASWGAPGAPPALPGRSGELLGSLLGLPKWLPEALPEASRAKARISKHFGYHFGSIFRSPGPRKSRFSCGKVAKNKKIARFEKNTKKAPKKHQKKIRRPLDPGMIRTAFPPLHSPFRG